jgi:hypothetical protein
MLDVSFPIWCLAALSLIENRLQGAYHLNLGNIRRAWLSFRRAISVAQLMGLQRPSVRSNDMPEDDQISRRHYLWFSLIKG